MGAVVEVKDLTKKYGDLVAVNDVSFEWLMTPRFYSSMNPPLGLTRRQEEMFGTPSRDSRERENYSFFREKEVLFWALAFLVFFMVLFGLIWKDDIWGNMPAINYLVPEIIVMALMSTCIIGTIEGFVEEREKGIYRRLSLTPLKRQTLIGGKIVSLYIVVLLQTAVLIGIGGNYLLFWVVLTLGALSFLAMGFALTSLAKNSKSAHPLSMIPFFILMFLGGIFFPVEEMPRFLRPVCNVLPSLHLNDALRTVAAQQQDYSHGYYSTNGRFTKSQGYVKM